MPSQAKPSLFLALLLASSYLLLSTCREGRQEIPDGQGEIPAQTEMVQSSEDTLEGPSPTVGARPDPETPTGSSNQTPAPVQRMQPPEPTIQPTAAPSAAPVQPTPLTVPAGETIDVEFRETLSSHTSQVGEYFRARITEPVVVSGETVIPAGASIRGVVLEAEPAKKIGGRARLALEFQTLSLANGTTYPIQAVFSQAGKSQTGKDAAIIGGATLGGAVLGKQVGGDTGTIIGAVAGGIGGALAAKKTKGKPVEIPAGTVMILELTQPVTIDVRP